MPTNAETVKSGRMADLSHFFEFRISCKVSTLRRIGNTLMIFLTTTSDEPDFELANRCLVLAVNEDRDQTRAIRIPAKCPAPCWNATSVTRWHPPSETEWPAVVRRGRRSRHGHDSPGQRQRKDRMVPIGQPSAYTGAFGDLESAKIAAYVRQWEEQAVMIRGRRKDSHSAEGERRAK